MVSLREMNERQAGWMAEKQTFDNSNELRVETNDRVIGWFASNGDDGNGLINNYRTHGYDRMSGKGTRYTIHRYCPVQSGEQGVPCAACQTGDTNIKERMSMYFWVSNILHASMPKDKQFPQVPYQGAYYFNEEVNAWRIWNTSSWKESPWTDICKLFEMYGGLHKFTFQMDVVGSGLQKRFKIYPLPNSAFFPPEMAARAKTECPPIPQILAAQLAQPIQQNPNAAAPGTGNGMLGQPQPTNIMPFTLPGQAAQPVFTPGAPGMVAAAPVLATAAPVAAFNPGAQNFTPAPPTAAPVAVAEPAPVAAPTPVATLPAPVAQVPVIEPQQPPAAVVNPNPEATPVEAGVEEDNRRPLKSMF